MADILLRNEKCQLCAIKSALEFEVVCADVGGGHLQLLLGVAHGVVFDVDEGFEVVGAQFF
jgi:hypothetical protein